MSTDGKAALITVQSARAPADAASRVFVRGVLNAQAARGDLKTATADLRLQVGHPMQLADFPTTVRSISETTGGRLQLVLGIGGDANRIRRIRVLGGDDQVVQDGTDARMTGQGTNAPATAYLNIPRTVTSLKLEYAYVENVAPVRVPFEAQIDIGHAKGGPMEGTAAQPEPAARAGEERPWPPPPLGAGGTQLPPRREAFVPSTHPATAPALQGASAQIFALAVGKPAPGETEAVRWRFAPAESFRPGGYTTFQVLLNTAGPRILSVPPDAISIERFQDDTGAELSTRARPPAAAAARGIFAQISTDGQQALVTFTLPSAPTPRATRSVVAGSVRTTVAIAEQHSETAALALKQYEKAIAGPFEVSFSDVRVPSLLVGDPRRNTTEVWLWLVGPIRQILNVELLDPKTRQILGSRAFSVERDQPSSNVGFSISMREASIDSVLVRIHHCERIESATVPFELTTGIGLE